MKSKYNKYENIIYHKKDKDNDYLFEDAIILDIHTEHTEHERDFYYTIKLNKTNKEIQTTGDRIINKIEWENKKIILPKYNKNENVIYYQKDNENNYIFEEAKIVSVHSDDKQKFYYIIKLGKTRSLLHFQSYKTIKSIEENLVNKIEWETAYYEQNLIQPGVFMTHHYHLYMNSKQV